MRVLVLGSGGREHAFVWKLAQSPLVERVYAVPGNAGMAESAQCLALSLEPPFEALMDYVESERIGLTVVGPEAPLVEGIVDAFVARGLRIFGPNQKTAQLEGSKAFAKERMERYGIPTASYRVFDDPETAKAYLRLIGAPVVVKADGLAAGKGTVVCETLEEAVHAVEEMMVHRRFGEAGRRVLIEERLVGEEASFIAICDGKTALPMASSQDHKRAFDGDRGPNTGGMGAYSPAPVVDDALAERLMREVVFPLMKGLASEGLPYQGFLYVGVMVTATGPKVLEFNCRLGDPEAQVLLPRLATDLVPVLEAAVEGRLEGVSLEWKEEACVCVVMASGGYPEAYRTGYPIVGLDVATARPDTVVFHAGTALENGRFVTKGGRVLGVTALGRDIREAVARAYAAVGDISFPDAHYRCDIGYRALARLG